MISFVSNLFGLFIKHHKTIMSSQDAYMSSQDADTRKLDLRRNEIHNKLKTVMDDTERQILMAEYGNILKQIQVARPGMGIIHPSPHPTIINSHNP